MENFLDLLTSNNFKMIFEKAIHPRINELHRFLLVFDCLFFSFFPPIFSPRYLFFFFLFFFYETTIKAVSTMEFSVGRKMVGELFIQRKLFRSVVSRIKPSFCTVINFYSDTIYYD